VCRFSYSARLRQVSPTRMTLHISGINAPACGRIRQAHTATKTALAHRPLDKVGMETNSEFQTPCNYTLSPSHSSCTPASENFCNPERQLPCYRYGALTRSWGTLDLRVSSTRTPDPRRPSSCRGREERCSPRTAHRQSPQTPIPTRQSSWRSPPSQ